MGMDAWRDATRTRSINERRGGSAPPDIRRQQPLSHCLAFKEIILFQIQKYIFENCFIIINGQIKHKLRIAWLKEKTYKSILKIIVFRIHHVIEAVVLGLVLHLVRPRAGPDAAALPAEPEAGPDHAARLRQMLPHPQPQLQHEQAALRALRRPVLITRRCLPPESGIVVLPVMHHWGTPQRGFTGRPATG